MAVPQLVTGRHEQQLLSAARYMRSRIMLARAEAAAAGAATGFLFVREDDAFMFRRYVDMNGDGVRTIDVVSGVDQPLGTGTRIGDLFAGVRFGLSPAVPPIGSRDAAGGGADPIRFGRSDILTLTPLGTATPGTLYLRSDRGPQAAVRVFGTTARVRLFTFDFASAQWRAR